MPITFAQIFLAALAFYFVVQSVVCLMEIVHLKRTINEVPIELVDKVSLAQHQKAAHYDIARTKLNWLEVTVTTALIVLLTEGNLINMIGDWLMQTVGDAFAFHWMLPASIGVIFVIVDLPFSWFKEFRLREAYGYCRIRPKFWLREFFLNTLVGWLAILPILWVGLFMWRHSGQTWWLIGWALYSIYLIFHLRLAKRLLYSFHEGRSTPIDDEGLITRLAQIGANAQLNISGAFICRESDNEDLPPAFAFGHKNNVRLYFRHDLMQRMSIDDLTAIAAHALARNQSHMYFQAWLVCSAVGFIVFAFLNWLAPQSWFLDEIGLLVYGPGPYYGSLMTFAIVALPVLLFPFKLPMDVFLRHLIFRSDKFALRYVGLDTLINALIDLTPTPIRHSTVTLGIFDLLFSHEPSLMARIKVARINAQKIQNKRNREQLRQELSLARQQQENVKRALATEHRREKIDRARQRSLDAQQQRLAYEQELVTRARQTLEDQGFDRHRLALTNYIDPDYDKAQRALAADNTLHATYGMSLIGGLRDLCRRYRSWRALVKAQMQARRDGLPMPNSYEEIESVKPAQTVDVEKTSAENIACEQQPTSAEPSQSEQTLVDQDASVANATVEETSNVVTENQSVESETDSTDDVVVNTVKPPVSRRSIAIKTVTERHERLLQKEQEHA